MAFSIDGQTIFGSSFKGSIFSIFSSFLVARYSKKTLIYMKKCNNNNHRKNLLQAATQVYSITLVIGIFFFV
jgi:hypothetical protein